MPVKGDTPALGQIKGPTSECFMVYIIIAL